MTTLLQDFRAATVVKALESELEEYYRGLGFTREDQLDLNIADLECLVAELKDPTSDFTDAERGLIALLCNHFF